MTQASFCSWAGWFESYIVENPEDMFSCDEAHIRPLAIIWWRLHFLVTYIISYTL